MSRREIRPKPDKARPRSATVLPASGTLGTAVVSEANENVTPEEVVIASVHTPGVASKPTPVTVPLPMSVRKFAD